MTARREAARAQLEDRMTSLGTAGLLLDKQVRLRIIQAISRQSEMAPLLAPALEYVDRAGQEITRTRGYLGDMWRAREKSGWKE